MSDVWQLCHGQKALRYFAKRGEQRLGGLIQSPEQLATLLTNTDWDLYVHINPTVVNRPSIKANASEVTHFSNLLIDIDLASPGADPLLAALHLMYYIPDLVKGSIAPISTIFSGRGVQLWLPFDLTPIQRETRLAIERSTSAFLRALPAGLFGCVVDFSCSDVSRVARLPGSINQKTGRQAKLLAKGRGSYKLESLLSLDPGPPPEVSAPQEIRSAEARGFVVPYVTAKAAEFLTAGVVSPGRHAAAYATAASLADLSIPFERACRWVSEGGRLCTPSLSPAESYRATTGAYQRKGLL